MHERLGNIVFILDSHGPHENQKIKEEEKSKFWNILGIYSATVIKKLKCVAHGRSWEKFGIIKTERMQQ